MLMVRFLLSVSTEGCSATQVYCPSSAAVIFLSVSVEDGRIQSSPWEKDGDIQESVRRVKQTERRSGSRRRKIGWIFCSPKGINKLVENLNCAELKAQEDLRIN